MKTLKANNYSQAIKEVEALDKDQAKRVKEEIKHSDRKHNHIVAVKISDRPGEAKNDVIVNTIIVNDDKLAKLKKNFKFLGFAKLIILHDASQVKEEGTPVLHIHDKQSIEAKMKAELEAKHKAEIDELKKKYEGEALEGKKNTDGDGKTEKELLEESFQKAIAGNKDELIEFMVANEISQEGITNNDQRKQSITAFYNTRMEILDGDQ